MRKTDVENKPIKAILWQKKHEAKSISQKARIRKHVTESTKQTARQKQPIDQKERSSLTERERIILQLSRQGLSDYKITRKINTDPPSVTCSRKNAQKKLQEAQTDHEWAKKIGVRVIKP